jgi:hypothetical protein
MPVRPAAYLLTSLLIGILIYYPTVPPPAELLVVAALGVLIVEVVIAVSRRLRRGEGAGEPATSEKKRQPRKPAGGAAAIAWLCVPLLALVAACRAGGPLPTAGTEIAVPIFGKLLARQVPASGAGAYGYILLPPTAPPGSVRAGLICEAFLAELSRTVDLPAGPKFRYVTTYWLLKAEPTKAGCEGLLESYDVDLARVMLASLDMNGTSGPVLAAWPEPWQKVRSTGGKGALVIDLSRVREADLHEVFGAWKSWITQIPDAWDGLAISVEKSRFVVRDMLAKFSGPVASAITVLAHLADGSVKAVAPAG